jgi:uncharacterized phage protein (TIGR02218 family)
MKALDANLKAHHAQGTTTIATCFKATLRNGDVVAATSHDRDLEIDGVLYLSVAAYNPSTIESNSDLNPDNFELEGFLQSPAITDTDIHSGRWDYAALEMFEVNYNDLTMAPNILRSGRLGQVRGGRSRFAQEFRGLAQAYSRRIVRLMTKECAWDLGDARCQVDLTGHTLTGLAVEEVTDNRVIQSQAVITDADWYTGGKVTFTSGENSAAGTAGVDLSMEIKRHGGADLTLHEQMPFLIAMGDTFTVHAGCMKRHIEDCIRKFDNVVNFGGFPSVVGSAVYGGPGTKIGTAPEPTPIPTPAPFPAPAPPPPPAPAPGPAPGGSPGARALATYFEVYYGDDPTRIYSRFNTVYLFHAKPNATPLNGAYTNRGNGSYQFQNFDTCTPARVQTIRARGQRAILTIGGQHAGFVYDTRAKSNNFLASFYDLYAAFGGLDGADFNNYEARIMAGVVGTFTTEMIYIAGQLKTTYGSDFLITTPAQPSYAEDRTLCAGMAGAGVLDWAAPQFYDWSGFNIPGVISGRIAEWVSLLGANRVMVGLGASYTNGPTLADCTREWDIIEAAAPTIRGAFGWSERTDRANGGVWSTAMAARVL